MIGVVYPLSVGNAIYLSLNAPCAAEEVILLRRWDDDFGELPEDPDAVVVHSGDLIAGLVDWRGLVNGVVVYYRLYALEDGAWTASDVVSATPESSFEGINPDIVDLVRERVQDGLNSLLQRSLIKHPLGKFLVRTAPVPVKDANFPECWIELEQDTSDIRFVGDFLGDGTVTGDTDHPYYSTDGYLSKISIACTIASLNPDERRLLRRVLKSILIANLTVFGMHGADNMDLSFQDDDDFQTYNAPMYMVVARISCTYPSTANLYDREIREIIQSVEYEPAYLEM